MHAKTTTSSLDESQIGILRAVIDVIIPPDNDPGGLAGGVDVYLMRQFERDLRSFVPIYQQGLLALDAEAQAWIGSPFTALKAEQQEAMFARIEQGDVQTTWPIDPIAFCAALAEHCAEGFYSDPGNGGNRDGVAWNMIGFEVTA